MDNKGAAAKAGAPTKSEAGEEFDPGTRETTYSGPLVPQRRKTAGRAEPAGGAEKEGAVPSSVTRSGPMKAVQGGIGRYLETLGLGPNPTLDEVNTTYFTFIKRFPENPTEEDEARLQEVKRAYEILRRNYQPKEEKRPLVVVDKRMALPLLGVTVVLMLAGLVALNWKDLRLKMIHYDSGTVVALKGQSEPYGQIVGYEQMHQFAVGNPSSAYALKLAGTETTVWVSERLVVNGMKPLGSK